MNYNYAKQENEVKIRHIAVWALIYIAIYSSLTVASCFFLQEQALITIGIVGAVFVLVNIFFLPFKRKWLFIGGILSAIGVMCAGIWIRMQLDAEGVLTIGATVSVMDILSFMKIGKRTVNAQIKSLSSFFAYADNFNHWLTIQ